MPKFKYMARDLEGQPLSGSVNATDEVELRRMLRANELFLIRSQSTGKSTTTTKAPLFTKKLNIRDMVVFSRQLATLVRAGLPIHEVLYTLRQQSENPELTLVLEKMAEDILAGGSLSQAMSRYPKVFNTLMICMVEAGETAGTLDQTLELAAHNMEREANLRDQVKAAMVYPKIVIVACLGTVLAMLLLVVPTFENVYKSLRADLPAVTLGLIKVSNLVISYWWAGLIGAFVLMKAFKAWSASGDGRRLIDVVSLRLPVVGPVVRKAALARFTQTLAGATKGGVPVLQALSISAGTCGNSVIQDAVMVAAARVSEGLALGPELERTGQFPLLVTRMVASGEMTGNLDEMLHEVNKFYEADVKFAVDKMVKIMEPLMTVLVGAVVLVILLALYMPIFKLGSATQGN
jgi:type IV pilus assembly protein PilC